MPEAREAQNGSQFEFITFATGGQSFCLEITQIREIRRWTAVTALPHTPDDVLGVMNLRGAVIPIFDLAAKFGLGHTTAHERNVVIVASVDGTTIGLLVESVSEILSVETSSIQETPDIRSDATSQSILGIISVNDSMIRVVNLESLLNSGMGNVA